MPLWIGFLLLIAARSAAQEAKTAAIDQGQRVFSCGHSFHFFMPNILAGVARSAKLKDHVQVGLSAIGGSRVIQHWNVAEEKNKAKEALRGGKVDVLTLAPIFLPDDGIEKFTTLALEHNPKIRVLVQINWLPWDQFDPMFPPKVIPKKVERNTRTSDELRKMHQPYYEMIDGHVRKLNEQYGKTVLFVVPVGQAVVALREKIIEGKAPGLKEQDDLFTDPIGHVKAPVRVLNAYCHYAVIYRKSPVGLPVPADLAGMKLAEGEALNRLLQELAWDAARRHPLSGVKAD